MFTEFDADIDSREITTRDLLRMANSLGVILADGDSANTQADEAKYFTDEYDAEDSGKVELKILEDDFDDFVGANDSLLEQHVQMMVGKIFFYCRDRNKNIRMVMQEAQSGVPVESSRSQFSPGRSS